jgi:hypothetical protein
MKTQSARCVWGLGFGVCFWVLHVWGWEVWDWHLFRVRDMVGSGEEEEEEEMVTFGAWRFGIGTSFACGTGVAKAIACPFQLMVPWFRV